MVGLKPGAALYDPQPGGDAPRVAPEGIIDEASEQIRWQQGFPRFGFDGAAHGVQSGGASAFVEFGDVVVNVVEVVVVVEVEVVVVVIANSIGLANSTHGQR